MVEDSLLSDELLGHLIAVGQVDVLVGVPTLNNAATIGGVVEAVHRAFDRYFPRDRTVLVNSDGGSSDGTPGIVRDYAGAETDTLTVSHGLRTTHRITTPYHGVPGKANALRQILAAAELTQARAVAVLDPDVTSVTPEWIAALIRPVRHQHFDYVAPVYQRHPLEAPLVTQFVRPLVRAAYGWRLREPLAAEFGCSSQFAGHCLEHDVWRDPLARYGIDLWITGTALSGDFRFCQTPLGVRHTHAGHQRPSFGDLFEQVVGATLDCLDAHAPYWTQRGETGDVPLVGDPLTDDVEAPASDAVRLLEAFCGDVAELQPVLQSILHASTLHGLNGIRAGDCAQVRYPDELWVSTVYDFVEARRRGVMRREHLAQALAPLYLGRAGSFLMQHEGDAPAAIEDATEELCVQFERAKPSLVQEWTAAGQR